MTLETLLSIASSAVSLGGLVAVLIHKDLRKKVALTVAFAVLLVMTVVLWHQSYQHNQMIERIEMKVGRELALNSLTFDQIYDKLYPEPFQAINEALFSAVEAGKVSHRVMECRSGDGSMRQVRVYYVEAPH